MDSRSWCVSIGNLLEEWSTEASWFSVMLNNRASWLVLLFKLKCYIHYLYQQHSLLWRKLLLTLKAASVQQNQVWSVILWKQRLLGAVKINVVHDRVNCDCRFFAGLWHVVLGNMIKVFLHIHNNESMTTGSVPVYQQNHTKKCFGFCFKVASSTVS